MKQSAQAFLEIADGISLGEFRGKPCFFKHISCRERFSMETAWNSAYSRALEFGYKTRAELFQKAKDEGRWTAAMEGRINAQKMHIESLEQGSEKLLDMESLLNNEDLMDEYRAELRKLEIEKAMLSAGSAEDCADAAQEQHAIILCSFYDKNLSESVLTEDDPMEDYMDLRAAWIKSFEKFSDFKSICADSNAVGAFSVFGEAAHVFFDRRGIDITDFQARFINMAKNVLYVLRECEIPAEDQEDYRKIMLYLKLKRNLERNEVETTRNKN